MNTDDPNYIEFLPCPQSGAGFYIALVSYPAGAAAGSYIASASSSYPAGAAAGFYIASVSSSYPARSAGQGIILLQFLFLSSFFFFFYLSTCQYLRDPMFDYAHTWSQ